MHQGICSQAIKVMDDKGFVLSQFPNINKGLGVMCGAISCIVIFITFVSNAVGIRFVHISCLTWTFLVNAVPCQSMPNAAAGVTTL